jgi:hypothetical protein
VQQSTVGDASDSHEAHGTKSSAIQPGDIQGGVVTLTDTGIRVARLSLTTTSKRTSTPKAPEPQFADLLTIEDDEGYQAALRRFHKARERRLSIGKELEDAERLRD